MNDWDNKANQDARRAAAERDARRAREKAAHEEAMKRIASGGGGGGCFPAGTRIATPSGYCDIADLKAGDEVMAVDLASATVTRCRVLGKRSYRSRPIWMIRLDDGTELRTTASHSFAIGGGWRKAGQLVRGDRIVVHRDGRNSLQRVQAAGPHGEPECVHNIVVEKRFTFLAEGIVAHSFTHFRALQVFLWSAYSGLSAYASHCWLMLSRARSASGVSPAS